MISWNEAIDVRTHIRKSITKGIEAHKAGKVQEADQYYTAILQAQPKHPDANHNMGVLAVGVGKVDQALPFLKTALEANPNIEQFWLSYIDALVKLEKLADAKAVLDQAKDTGVKGDAFDQLEKGLSEAGEEPLAASKTTLGQDRSQDPPQDQIQPLKNLYMQGHYKQASNQASQLLKEFHNSINLYNILGAANRGLGKLDEAIDAYTKAISIKPDFADAYSNIGNALKEQGKLEEAIDTYKKAISIKPDFAEAYYNMGVTLREQGKLDEAIDAYTKALSIKPDYAEAYNNMGVSLGDKCKLAEAINAYKAISIKPNLLRLIGIFQHC